MPSKVTIPNTFAAATTAIPLSQLDANFSNVNAAINNALTFSNYAVDAGTANNYSITITGQTTTYAAGLAFQFLAANANSGASTLNVNGQGAKSIIKSTGGALTAGDISAGAIISVMYDGTNFQLLNDTASGSETFTNITVTGTATINTANVTTFSPAITNAQLANSAITIGNTAVSLGGTITTINNATLVNANVSSGTVSVSSITDSGNLTFTGTGNRITGDFSNATTANRVAFQTSTTNGNTNLSVIPNGTATVGGIQVYSNSDIANSTMFSLQAVGTEARLNSILTGTGTYAPMTFYTGGSERMRIDTSGNVGIGTTSIESFGGGHKTLEVAGSTNTEGGVFKTATSGSAGSGSTGTEMLMFTDSVGGKINVISSHPAIFYTANTERMRIDSSGNVGIGTTSPAAKLQVNSEIRVSDGTRVAYLGSDVNDPYFGSQTNSALRIVTNATERMRITSGGDIGIGITSPSSKLDIYTASGAIIGKIRSAGSTGSDYSYWEASGGSYSQINITYGSGISYTYSNAPQYWVGTSVSSPLVLYTNNTERMRITSGGDLGVATTDPKAKIHAVANTTINNDATYAIIAGDSSSTNRRLLLGYLGSGNGYGVIQSVSTGTAWTPTFINPNGGEVLVAGTTDNGAYNLQCNGTGVWGAGAYVNGSDARIKEDVAPIDSGLDVVEKLNPVTYRYKEDWSKDQSTQTGFIAQELLVALEGQNYVDGVVQQGGSEGYYSVAYQNIIPILTKAIQELNAKIEAQAAEIQKLKGN